VGRGTEVDAWLASWGRRMKADAMRIKYLSLAVLDLAEIRAYISTNNPDAARRVGSRLKESINALKQFPNLVSRDESSGLVR